MTGDEKGALLEVRDVRQHAGERTRRWFTSPSMDLYLWLADDGTGYAAFEICYDKPHDQHALRWDRDRGFSHARIDDGESTPMESATPIAVPDGAFDATAVARRFEALSGSIAPAARDFVLGVLRG